MKKISLVGLVIAVLSLIVTFSIPVFAHGPTGGDLESPDQETWQEMHEACEEGDWEAMAEAAEEFHEEAGYGGCHGYGTGDEDYTSGWNGMMGGHMGGRGGMMGW
ncbi:MAG: hypothetical protein ACYS9T_04180 [Planctomycetota bacterium]|jgi:hypothetical protein